MPALRTALEIPLHAMAIAFIIIAWVRRARQTLSAAGWLAGRRWVRARRPSTQWAAYQLGVSTAAHDKPTAVPPCQERR